MFYNEELSIFNYNVFILQKYATNVICEQWQNVVTTNGNVKGDHVISGTKDDNLRISCAVQQGLQAPDVIPDVIVSQSFRREKLCWKKIE